MKNVILGLLMVSLLGFFGCDLNDSDSDDYDFAIFAVKSEAETDIKLVEAEDIVCSGVQARQLYSVVKIHQRFDITPVIFDDISYSRVIEELDANGISHELLEKARNSVAAVWYKEGTEIYVAFVED